MSTGINGSGKSFVINEGMPSNKETQKSNPPNRMSADNMTYDFFFMILLKQ